MTFPTADPGAALCACVGAIALADEKTEARSLRFSASTDARSCGNSSRSSRSACRSTSWRKAVKSVSNDGSSGPTFSSRANAFLASSSSRRRAATIFVSAVDVPPNQRMHDLLFGGFVCRQSAHDRLPQRHALTRSCRFELVEELSNALMILEHYIDNVIGVVRSHRSLLASLPTCHTRCAGSEPFRRLRSYAP
jgi:hypothetical protein